MRPITRTSDALSARTVEIVGHGGDAIEAYQATPDGPGARGGVVVIHHLPGYDRDTKEMVRRFAELGYDAVCPNLYSREAPGAEPSDAAAAVRALGGVPDEQLIGDVAGAAAHLRTLSHANGKVGVIGHCSGGRQAVLAACHVDLQAAVDCYGAFVTRSPEQGFPLKMSALVDQLPELRCPLLGLFGDADVNPSPADVDDLGAILTREGKTHRFCRYEGADHAFFSSDRPSYHVEAANRGWAEIATFFSKTLGD
jgi:carboxymethylenebutenolidase